MSSPVPELSSSPVPTSPPVLKPSSIPLSSPSGVSVSKPSLHPLLSPHVLPVVKPSPSPPVVPPISKPSPPTPHIPPGPNPSSNPLHSTRVPPVSKPFSPPLPRSSAPRKPSVPPQPRAPVPHSVAKSSSPALPRPPPPSARTSSSALPTPLVPVTTKPALAPTLAPALDPASAPALVPASAPALVPASAPALALTSPPSISILEKLIKTCPVWLQLTMAQEKALLILKKECPGIFLVRKTTDQKSMVLSVCVSNQQVEPHVQDVLVKEEKSLLYLEGSVLVFDNIFKLIAFYSVSRDILPFTLRLPQVIVQATKYEDIEMMSLLGSDFWGSQLNSSSPVVDQVQGHKNSSCEIQLSAGSGNDHLWYINPIFIDEYCSSLEASSHSPTPVYRSQSLNTPGQFPPKFKRPPPRPPNVPECLLLSQGPRGLSDPPSPRSPPPPHKATGLTQQKAEGNSSKDPCERERDASQKDVSATVSIPAKPSPQPLSAQGATAGQRPPAPRQPTHRIPPVPQRRKPSENRSQTPLEPEEGTLNLTTSSKTKEKEEDATVPVASLVCINKTPDMAEKVNELMETSGGEILTLQKQGTLESPNTSGVVSLATAPLKNRAPVPVPPPRKKKSTLDTPSKLLPPDVIGEGLLSSDSSPPHHQTSSVHLSPSRPILFPVGEVKEARGLDVSLYSPEGGAALPVLEHDSYSTSSTEEEPDSMTGGASGINNTKPEASVKRTSTIMLDRAKHRLSLVNFSSVFTNLLSADHKLQKRIVELSRDRSSYFGGLLKDYRVYILEAMGRHTSSTELLQEIRQMMTQLKSYLIQSTELENLLEPNVYTEDKLEVIIEAALCKAVLKPLREAVYSGLKDIHTRDGCLKRLKENQSVVLATTTTDLGITTSIPEAPVMEKIQLKLMTLNKEYSPQKKIDLLLKTCKLIYESMSVGCPAGRAHGADDFLPVLMYVLVRCNMTSLLLDVEYMMELMDPALQLGEGSYYLTTTYGALEHIKNYDKQPVTRQLSLEIQDSIHRWERRRTLNKARVSRSSVQDFINVSFLEAGCNTKTLGVRPTTTAQDLCAQCAEKFEVFDAESYSLTVLVEGHYQPIGPEEFPVTIKSSLHHSEPQKEYFFIYRPGRTESEGQEAETEDSMATDAPEPEVEESLIEI
ncbi:hypothetical protein UPYG_G00231760 [Umbra pygmaea]|uniref:Ras and Rab interactor 3 n=1 Tax=Umbra pygmaea TaxID=75934 RepID=A0ABD0X449_UMBPY